MYVHFERVGDSESDERGLEGIVGEVDGHEYRRTFLILKSAHGLGGQYLHIFYYAQSLREVTLSDSHTYAGRNRRIGEVDILKCDRDAFALEQCLELVGTVICVYGYCDESVRKHRRFF